MGVRVQRWKGAIRLTIIWPKQDDLCPESWSLPPEAAERFLVDGDEVHIWLASLSLSEAELQARFATLLPDERKRADGFACPHNRGRFIAGRGLLRAILAGYTGQQPGDLHFATNGHGKPQLAADAESPLRFNMTHSRDLALYAIARGREVGIDLEWTHKEMDFQGLADRFFSAREAAALRTCPPEGRREAFFACWTRKEAYVKARGQGLSLGLDTFEVALTIGGPPALISRVAESGEQQFLSVYGFTPAPGYAAALAVEGCSCKPVWRRWPVSVC